MIGGYPDRMYFTYNKELAKTIPELKYWAGDKDKNFIMLTIEIDKNDYPRKRFFYDNNMINSVYTLENIPPQWIVNSEKIRYQ